MWDRINVRLPRHSVMASRAYKLGDYFRRSVVAKSSEQSSAQSEDIKVDISRKDLDDHESVVDESTRKSRSTQKDVEEGLPSEKSKKSHAGKRKASFASESATKRLKKWSWTLEAVEILLKYITEFKTKCEFERRGLRGRSINNVYRNTPMHGGGFSRRFWP